METKPKPPDGGYKSRKMVMAYIAMLLITFGFAATGKWEVLKVTYAEFIAGILAATTIFTGGNVITKLIQRRNVKKKSSKNVPSSKA